MTLQDFEEALLAWGADLRRWPSEEARRRADALLAADEDARALYAEFVAFDADLAAAASVETLDAAIAARTQAAVGARIDADGIWTILPLKRILGLGSLAGLGGAVAAMASPASVNVGLLLAIALGGAAP